MSLILDALNRSRQEQQAPAVPGIDTVPSVPIAEPRGHPLLENAVGDFYGRISYSLYLTHIPILVAAKPWLQQAPGLGLVLYLAAATAVAWLSYRVIELPSQRFIRGFAKA